MTYADAAAIVKLAVIQVDFTSSPHDDASPFHKSKALMSLAWMQDSEVSSLRANVNKTHDGVLGVLTLEVEQVSLRCIIEFSRSWHSRRSDLVGFSSSLPPGKAQSRRAVCCGDILPRATHLTCNRLADRTKRPINKPIVQ